MAIAANELKHGCWYFFERYGEGRLWINDDYTFYIEFPNQSNEMLSKFSYTQIKPIPISPEILIACGFREGEKNQSNFVIDLPDDNLLGYEWGNFEHHIDLNGMFLPQKFKYLHQLQNLYFALTGKELELIQISHDRKNIYKSF